jgi:hypothetical protein
MTFNALLAVGTLVFTFVNFLTYVRSKNVNGVVTQAIAWVAGILAILIAAHTQFAPDITFGNHVLSKLDWQSQVFLGLIATSILSTVNEVKKAIDNKDTAEKAPLIPGRSAQRATVPTVVTGQAQLVGGRVTVAHSAAKPDSQIFLTPQDDQTVGSLHVSSKAPGSFSITSSVPSDSGVVSYQISDAPNESGKGG